MKIYLTDGTEFTERTAMAIDPPTTAVSPTSKGPYASMTLEGLTQKLQRAEAEAGELPFLRAELAERMAAMFPGQKLVKARKAKGGAK